MCVVNRVKNSIVKVVRSRHFKDFTPIVVTGFLLTISVCSYAGGEEGIQEATDQVKGYFDAGVNLMYAVGAVLGLIGAVKVYQKWSNGHPDTGSTAAAWFGACVFLVIVATVLKSFFGL